MKVAITRFDEYKPDLGKKLKTNPVWQFLVEPNTPWVSKLYAFEEVVEDRKVDMSFLGSLFGVNDNHNPADPTPKETEDINPSSLELDNSESALQTLLTQKMNLSVLGIGVSSETYTNYESELKQLEKDIYVLHDFHDIDDSELLNEVQGHCPVETGVTHVTWVSCSQSTLFELLKWVSQTKNTSIRFVGDNVLKLNGFRSSGLFSKAVLKTYALETKHVQEHPFTQVVLVENDVEQVPLELLEYPNLISSSAPAKSGSDGKKGRPSKNGSKTPSAQFSKGGGTLPLDGEKNGSTGLTGGKNDGSKKRVTKPKATKPAKPKKLDRRSLFS